MLNIFDLRENNSKRSDAPGLSVEAHRHGIISVDFDHERVNCICTVGERDKHVKLWDMRRLTAPVVQLYTQSLSIVKARFHPTAPGVLAVASRDDAVVSLWDIKSDPASNEYFDRQERKVGQDRPSGWQTTKPNASAPTATLTFRKAGDAGDDGGESARNERLVNAGNQGLTTDANDVVGAGSDVFSDSSGDSSEDSEASMADDLIHAGTARKRKSAAGKQSPTYVCLPPSS